MNIQEEFRKQGYAPGEYTCSCQRCQQPFTGDKRAWCCFSCAAERIDMSVKTEEGWHDTRNELPSSNDVYLVCDKDGSRGCAHHLGNGMWGGWPGVLGWQHFPALPIFAPIERKP